MRFWQTLTLLVIAWMILCNITLKSIVKPHTQDLQIQFQHQNVKYVASSPTHFKTDLIKYNKNYYMRYECWLKQYLTVYCEKTLYLNSGYDVISRETTTMTTYKRTTIFEVLFNE